MADRFIQNPNKPHQTPLSERDERMCVSFDLDQRERQGHVLAVHLSVTCGSWLLRKVRKDTDVLTVDARRHCDMSRTCSLGESGVSSRRPRTSCWSPTRGIFLVCSYSTFSPRVHRLPLGSWDESRLTRESLRSCLAKFSLVELYGSAHMEKS
jgi:hypothetical protein